MVKLAMSWQKASLSSSIGFKGNSRKNTHIFGSLYVLVCVINTMAKRNLWRKRFISLQLQALMGGRSGKELKAEAIEALLSGLVLVAHCSACFLHNPGPLTQGQHPQQDLGLPTSITNEENAPTPLGLPTENLMEALSQLRLLFPGNSSLCQVQGKEKPLELKKGPF